MSNQITIRLDETLDASARSAAAAAGVTLTDWVRSAISHQAAVAAARRARAQEDAEIATYGPLYTDEQEDALIAARQRRALAAFAGDFDNDPDGPGPGVGLLDR